MDEKVFNSWKQPIPTNLDQVFRGDYFCKFIYIELLLRARSRDEQEIRGTDRRDAIRLSRGQCVCGEEELGKMFKRSRQWARQRLNSLQNWYNLIDILKTSKGSVITVRNFDEVTKLDILKDTKYTAKRQPKDTNNNDKSDKEDILDLTKGEEDVIR